MRQATITRETGETNVTVSLNLDGGPVSVDTGVGFLDHMLEAFAVHGGFGLTVTARGDLKVDAHHTVEDTGIVLGRAFAGALGEKNGIARYGHAVIPMDEALGFAAADIGGRAFLVFDAVFPQRKTGDFDTCLVEEFFRALAFHAGMTLHLQAVYGKNAHHMIESLFKAAGHALRAAVTPLAGTLSTKGHID